MSLYKPKRAKSVYTTAWNSLQSLQHFLKRHSTSVFLECVCERDCICMASLIETSVCFYCPVLHSYIIYCIFYCLMHCLHNKTLTVGPPDKHVMSKTLNSMWKMQKMTYQVWLDLLVEDILWGSWETKASQMWCMWLSHLKFS